MLKTNSKQARLNIQAYIKNHFDGCSYGVETPDTFKDTKAARYTPLQPVQVHYSFTSNPLRRV